MGFLTAKALVLLAIAADPEATQRDLASDVDLTERTVHGIVQDLVADGLILVNRVGRRNEYRVRRADIVGMIRVLDTVEAVHR